MRPARPEPADRQDRRARANASYGLGGLALTFDGDGSIEGVRQALGSLGRTKPGGTVEYGPVLDLTSEASQCQ